MEHVVNSVTEVIRNSRYPHIADMWRGVKKVSHPHQVTAASCSVIGTDEIAFYPRIKSDERAIKNVLRCLGKLFWMKIPSDRQDSWLKKMVLPEAWMITDFQSKIASSSFESYERIVRSVESPVTRMVFIHLANALISNNVSVKDAAVKIDIKTWPCTEQFANLKKPYSLIPLLGAYGYDELFEFPESFAEGILGFTCIYESTVRECLFKLLTAALG